MFETKLIHIENSTIINLVRCQVCVIEIINRDQWVLTRMSSEHLNNLIAVLFLTELRQVGFLHFGGVGPDWNAQVTADDGHPWAKARRLNHLLNC